MRTKLYRFPSGLPAKPGIAACLGNFDGIHAGHRALLQKASAKAKIDGLKTMLVSFYPHPALVLNKAVELPIMTPPGQMIEILSELGIDYLYFIHFTKEFSKISAENFIKNTLIDKLNINYIVVGEDARVGSGGQGDADFIAKIFREAGRHSEIEKFVEIKGTRISSRLVRTCVQEGEVEKAAVLLDRNFSLQGRVTKGQSRGKSLGYPTANLKSGKNVIIPSMGVYATYCKLSGRQYSSVTNIGLRPTLESAGIINHTNLSIETYMIDYKGPDFYKQKIDLQFVKKLRDEMKFPSLDELKKQIGLDIEAAKKILT